jgi:hypothetical protein
MCSPLRARVADVWSRPHRTAFSQDARGAAIAERLMELEIGAATRTAYGKKSPLRVVQRNGYRDKDGEMRIGTVELRVPKLRKGLLLSKLAGSRLPAMGALMIPASPESTVCRRTTLRDTIEVFERRAQGR